MLLALIARPVGIFFNYLIARIISLFPGGPGSVVTLNPMLAKDRLTLPFAQ